MLTRQHRWLTRAPVAIAAATATRAMSARPATEEKSQKQQSVVVDRANQHLLGLYKRPDVVLERGEGIHLYDMTGKRYMDFTAGIAVNSLGHGHPAIREAIENQLKSGLIHTSNLYHTLPATELAEMLVQACRAGDAEQGVGFDADKVFLCNSGTEANEAALKFARKFGAATSKYTPKYKILSFRDAFHGRTFGSLSATPTEKYQQPFQPLIAGFKHASFNDLDSARKAMDEDTCAILVEPIQGEGGINLATPEFLRGLRELCNEYGALLIFDEIQCGLGRTGELFAHPSYNVYPDILTVAKPLANGIPIGATVLSSKVAIHIAAGDHGTTFGGNPFACSVAKAALNVINQPSFLAQVRSNGKFLLEQMELVQKACPAIVKQVRGKGLIAGMELRVNPGDKFISMAMERGLLLVAAGKNTVRFVPPLIVSQQEIRDAVNIVQECLKALESDIHLE